MMLKPFGVICKYEDKLMTATSDVDNFEINIKYKKKLPAALLYLAFLAMLLETHTLFSWPYVTWYCTRHVFRLLLDTYYVALIV